MPMPATQPELQESKARLRKSHRKSRYGCANCKIRRVKCDESKPRCLKCVSFGVGCTYETGVSEMQLDFSGSFRVDMTPTGQPSFALPLPRSLPDLPTYLPLVGARPNELYQVGPFDRDLLKKFRECSVLTVGPKDAAMLFQAHALEFSINSPFLTHLILAFALLYDMHTTGRRDKQKTAALAFHFYHGVSLFNAKLSKPVEHAEKDALWAAAALTGASAFADVKDAEPADTWPLSSTPTDLDWLKMTGGKQAVYNITNPIRPASLFNASCSHFLDPPARVGSEILNLLPEFVQFYNLDELSTPKNNPYHCAATVLAQVMPLDCNRNTISKFLSFVGFPDPRFLRLLEQRDPRAMLLLAYWYAKALSPEHWWIWRRAIAEGPAICTFLEGAFSGDPELLELLEFPKAAFAAASVKHRSARAI